MDPKIYALFAGERRYPIGGAEDFKRLGALDELMAVDLEKCVDHRTSELWANIADTSTMKVVAVWLNHPPRWFKEETA